MTEFYKKSQHKTIIGLVIVFLFIIIIFLARLGLADIYGFQAHRYILMWQENKNAKVEDIPTAMKWITKARHLDKSNPRFMTYQARVFEWRARKNRNRNEAQHDLEQSAQLYRDALKVRPTWPYSWTGLANMKAKLGQFDDEFSKSIERATTLGPWEALIQIQIVDIGFRNWEDIEIIEQGLILETYDRSLLGGNIKRLVEIGVDHDQFESFCYRTQFAENYGPWLIKKCEATKNLRNEY